MLESDPDVLIILGDLKEPPLGLSFRLKEMLLRFFSPPIKDIEIVITKGNHDAESRR
ncbi:metallophosphoesterase [Thermococcus sp. JCM 11816]|uniref:metallophosphoesterase n=1 Tax=Thermococcus sp. (strain JCM 11816 / KS-1) TaxID=1295125 RepID=UPI000A5837E6